jgi:peptidoglycan DL-endopeptidase CwlO
MLSRTLESQFYSQEASSTQRVVSPSSGSKAVISPGHLRPAPPLSSPPARLLPCVSGAPAIEACATTDKIALSPSAAAATPSSPSVVFSAVSPADLPQSAAVTATPSSPSLVSSVVSAADSGTADAKSQTTQTTCLASADNAELKSESAAADSRTATHESSAQAAVSAKFSHTWASMCEVLRCLAEHAG